MNKSFLQAFRKRSYEARQIRARLVEMESRMYSPKGQIFTSMPHAPSGQGHTMDDLAEAHLRLQDRYRAMLAAVERDQLSIEDALLDLEPKERMLIRYRYMDLMTWEEVSFAMTYSWAQVHRIHGSALRKLEKI